MLERVALERDHPVDELLGQLAEVAERRVEDHRVDGVVADEREVLLLVEDARHRAHRAPPDAELCDAAQLERDPLAEIGRAHV